jgi:hypothetical protein
MRSGELRVIKVARSNHQQRREVVYLDGEDSVGEVDGVPGQVEEVVDHTNEGVDVGLEVALRQHERVLELGAVYHTKSAKIQQ